MLKKKPKTSKPSKLPIPRRAAAAAKAEPAKAKPAKQPAPVATPAPAVPEVEPTAAEPAPAPAEAPVAAPSPAAAKPTSKLSCLDAAAEVLKGAKEPMRCRELVDAMAAPGLWTSTAPTPHQTLASALLREVTKKGAASRFRKADRGRFAPNAG